MRFLILPILLLVSPLASATGLHFGVEGLEIDGGSIGKFTLAYPSLLDGSHAPIHKLVDKQIHGNTVTLRYAGNAEATMSVGDGGTVRVKFANTPADVKAVAYEMHIPIGFNQGGNWIVDGKETAFPKEKQPKPHLYQGNNTTIGIRNYEGKKLVLKMPDYSFLQLTDNREWNWDIYHFTAFTPFDSTQTEHVATISTEGEGAKVAPLVDPFGQLVAETWPGKLKNIDELKVDEETERTFAASLHPPQFDPYGGLPGSMKTFGLRATGFFHMEKKGNRWHLVDPAGNTFFHLGVCGVNPSDDYTQIEGRESAYEWLPSRTGEFQSAFRPGQHTTFSFHLANMIRKTGLPYRSEDYTARMISRMRKWGFNSIGAFSSGGELVRKKEQFPAVAFLPLAQWDGIKRIPNIEETIDPFDEETRAGIERNLARTLPTHANDPLIIGYFIVNEPIYENIPHMLPTLNRTHACKREFVKWLERKYKQVGEFNSAWQTQAKGFDELNDRVLRVESPSAKSDVQAFTGVFLEEYFRLITETFRRYDSNHLLIGSRLQPGTINNEQLCRIAGKYLDVMSFNYYTYALDKKFLQQIYDWTGGRPMMLSEFYWGATRESGLSGGREVATQQERGLAYRNYVEQAASLDFIVGIEWFTLVDQSVTGRWFQGFNGERANTGLIAVTDRPWTGMITEMVKTNYDIYKVMFGERKPYSFTDGRFTPNTPANTPQP